MKQFIFAQSYTQFMHYCRQNNLPPADVRWACRFDDVAGLDRDTYTIFVLRPILDKGDGKLDRFLDELGRIKHAGFKTEDKWMP